MRRQIQSSKHPTLAYSYCTARTSKSQTPERWSTISSTETARPVKDDAHMTGTIYGEIRTTLHECGTAGLIEMPFGTLEQVGDYTKFTSFTMIAPIRRASRGGKLPRQILVIFSCFHYHENYFFSRTRLPVRRLSWEHFWAIASAAYCHRSVCLSVCRVVHCG